MNFWEAIGAGGGQPYDHITAWAQQWFRVHTELIKAGFTVEQAFELVKIEMSHRHTST